jgi:hypothetical protein
MSEEEPVKAGLIRALENEQGDQAKVNVLFASS